MSRMAEIIVLAGFEDEVMEPLTRPDATRTWRGHFTQISDWFVGGWYIDFFRVSQRSGVLKDLEALPWNRPERVQVMVHDEDDDCFGLWMFRDGALVEVGIPGTRRIHTPPPSWRAGEPDPGVLVRTDPDGTVPGHWPEHSPEHVQDPRLSW